MYFRQMLHPAKACVILGRLSDAQGVRSRGPAMQPSPAALEGPVGTVSAPLAHDQLPGRKGLRASAKTKERHSGGGG
jgi:hypothetical protein